MLAQVQVLAGSTAFWFCRRCCRAGAGAGSAFCFAGAGAVLVQALALDRRLALRRPNRGVICPLRRKRRPVSPNSLLLGFSMLVGVSRFVSLDCCVRLAPV